MDDCAAKHSPHIRLPLNLVLVSLFVLTTLLPIVILELTINTRAQENVELRVMQLTEGILETARYHLNFLLQGMESSLKQHRLTGSTIKDDSESIIDEILLTPLDTIKSTGSKGFDTAQILKENPQRVLWTGQLAFAPEKRPRLWVSMLYRNQGKNYALSVSLNPMAMSTILSHLGKSTNSEVIFISPDNIVFPVLNYDFFNEPYATRAINRAFSGELTSFTSNRSNKQGGEPVLVHLFSDAQYLYNLIAITPRAELSSPVRNAVMESLVLLAAFSIVICSIITLVIWRTARRFKQLQAVLINIANANFSFDKAVPNISIAEVEHLFDGIITMSAQLEKSLSEVQESREKLSHHNEILEQKVNERTAELKLSLEELSSARDIAMQAEKMASLGRTVARFTHELNTPLSVCFSAAESLESSSKVLSTKASANNMTRNDLDEHLSIIAEASGIIMRNITQSHSITASLKHVASDHDTQECRLFKVQSYLSDVLASVIPRSAKKRISVELSCTDSIEYQGDPSKLYQIVSNLVVNSLKHGFDESSTGTIRVQIDPIESMPHAIILAYSDSGVGMNEEQKNRLFEPFFTTKKHAGGTGLGMYIVKNLVEQDLQGSIQVRSEIGNGTHFTIVLPPSYQNRSPQP